MFTCCSNCYGDWLQIVGIVASICTAFFAFLAIACTRTNSLISNQIELMPLRIKIADVSLCFLRALESGFNDLQKKEYIERTVFNLGEAWLSAVTSASEYKRIAKAIGYEAGNEDNPCRVYSDGNNGFSDLIGQSRFVFSSEVYSELKNLNDLFFKYGSETLHPKMLDNENLSEDEISHINKLIGRIDLLKGKLESEIKLDKMPKPLSLAMVKMLFGERE